MASFCSLLLVRNPGQLAIRWYLAALVLACTLAACAGSPPEFDRQVIGQLAPLRLDGDELPALQAAASVETPDLLATDDTMREFVARYTTDVGNSRQRMMSLHRAITGAGVLNMQYDPFADGSAQEVFHRGTANCLSYANLFVALAREAGLDAHYQWLEVRPRWSRVGERVSVGLHVNVLVRLRSGERYMVDIDPLPSRDITDSREISDRDARALYHSNIAMGALAEDDLQEAWRQGVRAVQINPQMAHLWVNLGAVYRSADQHREAEKSYLRALELDPWSSPAMTNLAILYDLENRHEEREYWQGRVDRYQQANPYYHAWLGDQAGKAGDWSAALEQYDMAVSLKPDDSSLLFARGMILYQLHDLQRAAADLKRAVKFADLRADMELYQRQLDELRREQLVGL
jgi:tetratricopeptide (TPR) repeat protein